MSFTTRIGTMLLIGMVGGCYSGTHGDVPSGPTDPIDDPTLPAQAVGAVLFGYFVSNPSILPNSMTFDVLEADCLRPIAGVAAMNRFEGKRKLSYKYQFRVERAAFEACVKINVSFTPVPGEAPLTAEVIRMVNFTVQGAGLAPQGIQVDIPLIARGT